MELEISVKITRQDDRHTLLRQHGTLEGNSKCFVDFISSDGFCPDQMIPKVRGKPKEIINLCQSRKKTKHRRAETTHGSVAFAVSIATHENIVLKLLYLFLKKCINMYVKSHVKPRKPHKTTVFSYKPLFYSVSSCKKRSPYTERGYCGCI